MTETWEESDSRVFLEYGRAFTPQWTQLRDTFLRLIPARLEESFKCVDIGAGSGWMSESVLERFPEAKVLAFDGSPMMLEHLRSTLARFEPRFAAQSFDLVQLKWLAHVPDRLRCAFSSLAIHHLDNAAKRWLFADLYARLSPGGSFLYADLVEPISALEADEFASAWDACVQRQSLALYGDLRAFDRFVQLRWNYYRYPDPVDKPAKLEELLLWLGAAGFAEVEVFWKCAGHILIAAVKQ